MNERFEIEIIVCCPECGHYYRDWIMLDIKCPFLIEESCKECKEMEGLKAL